jgi:hypothetical protein
MTGFAKVFFTIGGLIILALIICVIYVFLFVGGFIYTGQKQMNTGKKYMDSLTDKDIQIWIHRTQKYLDEYDPNAYVIGAKPVPDDLKQLKILRIDELSNQVDYVWMGGLDHTEMDVRRQTDGSFQLIAMYNDESNRVIWPRP